MMLIRDVLAVELDVIAEPVAIDDTTLPAIPLLLSAAYSSVLSVACVIRV
jgi:hypothetical protein